MNYGKWRIENEFIEHEKRQKHSIKTHGKSFIECSGMANAL